MSGYVPVDPFEEGQHVTAGVGVSHVVEDLTAAQVHRGEQVNGHVTPVVVGHGAGPSRFHRQRRLGAIEGLALGLLIETEHCRSIRWIVVEPDDVDQLGLEIGIGRQLEGIGPPRSQVSGPPNRGDRVLADPVTFRHRPGRPTHRTVFRNRSQRVGDHRFNHFVADHPFAAPPGTDRPDPGRATNDEPVPPPGHRVRPCPQLPSNPPAPISLAHNRT